MRSVSRHTIIREVSMNKQSLRREGGLAYEIATISAAVALCLVTYFIASQLGAPPLKTLAGADTAPASSPSHN
jgi:hypothetical protein